MLRETSANRVVEVEGREVAKTFSVNPEVAKQASYKGSTKLESGRDNTSRLPQQSRALNYVLWTIQGLLALLFLFAGGMKLILPLDQMTGPVPLPGLFLRFIGVAEVLGGLGLILPGMFRLWRILTPLAAAGLVIIMIGATVITLMGGTVAPAMIPFVVGLLLTFVARKRWGQ